MIESVYAETSIFSYLTARPSRDLISAARQQITVQWWDTNREKYRIYASNLVVAEASQGDELRAQVRVESIRSIPLLEITQECARLAEKIIRDSPMPEKARDDALHAAVASFHSIDFLLTWNCRHLANAHVVPKVRAVVESEGFKFPQICTPEELMEDLK